MAKYSTDEMERRGIDGMHTVMMYDSSMGYESRCVVIDWVSKAVANSIAKHMNKQIPDGINIVYFVECRDDREPSLSHWL